MSGHEERAPFTPTPVWHRLSSLCPCTHQRGGGVQCPRQTPDIGMSGHKERAPFIAAPVWHRLSSLCPRTHQRGGSLAA
jgi:NADPH-dependent 7-cyano-7-deazaguanine reductase QueF